MKPLVTMNSFSLKVRFPTSLQRLSKQSQTL